MGETLTVKTWWHTFHILIINSSEMLFHCIFILLEFWQLRNTGRDTPFNDALQVLWIEIYNPPGMPSFRYTLFDLQFPSFWITSPDKIHKTSTSKTKIETTYNTKDASAKMIAVNKLLANVKNDFILHSYLFPVYKNNFRLSRPSLVRQLWFSSLGVLQHLQQYSSGKRYFRESWTRACKRGKVPRQK